jgi:hypothetical protein
MTDKQPYTPLTGLARGPGCCDKCRAAVVEFFIFFAWLCLELINVILLVFNAVASIFKCLWSDCPCDPEPKHVVVVGASFGGLAVQRELSKTRGLKVTRMHALARPRNTRHTRHTHTRHTRTRHTRHTCGVTLITLPVIEPDTNTAWWC